MNATKDQTWTGESGDHMNFKVPTDCEISAVLSVRASLCDMDLTNVGTTSALVYVDCTMIIPTELRATTQINIQQYKNIFSVRVWDPSALLQLCMKFCVLLTGV